jgi:hypothetical protein
MSLFKSFDELIEIEVCGRPFQVPEKNNLLRCFQFLEMDAVAMGDYCWNGDCSNCLVSLKSESGAVRTVMACRTEVRPRLVITALAPGLEELFDGKSEPGQGGGALKRYR